jgi:hypothetical protein
MASFEEPDVEMVPIEDPGRTRWFQRRQARGLRRADGKSSGGAASGLRIAKRRS